MSVTILSNSCVMLLFKKMWVWKVMVNEFRIIGDTVLEISLVKGNLLP